MTQAAMDSTMVAVTPELLPCPSPWCDHRAHVASTDDDAFYGKAFQGRCTQCGLGGPVKRTEAEAIAAWNTRHQSGRTGAGEALREALENYMFAEEIDDEGVRQAELAIARQDALAALGRKP